MHEAPGLPRQESVLVPQGLASVSPTRAAAPETPFFFASGDRPCYAVLHAAARARASAPVVVHVHGLGVEQLTLYRQEVLVARAEAALGFPVMRYHARGHGDSAGDAAAVTLGSLIEDALAAADEAKRRTGASRVIWMGVRFGGLVAAMAGARRADSAGLVLWEPVLQPLEFFRAQLRFLLFSRVAGGVRPDATADQLIAQARAGQDVDVNGYLLHREILESSEGASLSTAMADWRAPVLLAQVQQRAKLAPGFEALATTLRDRGVPLSIAQVREEPGYQNLSNPAWECPALTRSIAEWLDALA